MSLEDHSTCPTCSAPFRKRYEFGRWAASVADVLTYRCRHAVAIRYDPCGILRPVEKTCANYSEASGIATLHKLLLQEKGLD